MLYEVITEFVNAPGTQGLMQRIRTAFDPEIEAKGWDKIRSRVEVVLNSDSKIIKEADERYRGGPDRITSYNVCYTKLLRDAELPGAGQDGVLKVGGHGLADLRVGPLTGVIADLAEHRDPHPVGAQAAIENEGRRLEALFGRLRRRVPVGNDDAAEGIGGRLV